MRRWLRGMMTLLWLCLSLVTPLAGMAQAQVAPATALPEGFEFVAESSALKLYINRANSQLILEDKRNGAVWHSNPLQAEEKRSFGGDFAKHAEGPFLVRWVRRQALTTVVLASALWDGKEVTDIVYEPLEGGIRARYTLKSIEIQLTVEYRVRDDHLEVNVPEGGIVESEDNLLVSVEMLPFFGAPPAGSDASIVFPDGSGALLTANQPLRGIASQLTRDTYGPHYFEFTQTAYERMTLPLVGITHGQRALLAVAVRGDAETAINVWPEGIRGPRSGASMELVYRTQTMLPRRRADLQVVYQEWRLPGDRTVRYYVLNDQDASYVGMAHRYRDYLIAEKGTQTLTDVEGRLNLRLFCGVRRKFWFGYRFIAMTTFAQAQEIIGDLLERGVTDFDVTLVGWNKHGYDGAVPRRLPVERKLGGDRGLQQLTEYAHAHGVRVFLEDNYLDAFTINGGFSARRDTVRQSSGIPNYSSENGHYLLNPTVALLKYAQRDIAKLKKLGVDGLELRHVGQTLLSDSNERYPLSRDQFASRYQDLMALSAQELGHVWTQGGNAYVLGAAEHITDAPLRSSEYNIATTEIPLWPLVTHGLVTYSGKPYNLSADPHWDLLRQIEYGALPRFELTYQRPEELERTRYNSLFSSHYVQWLDMVEEHYRTLQEMQHLAGQRMTDHAQMEVGVFQTVYEDGTRVLVNYNATARQVGEVVLPGYGYAILRGATGNDAR